jgi:nucleoside-diphosphate-sugar epimerase
VLSAVRRALEPPAARSASSDAVLVTGGTGFIGQKLVSALEDDASVIAPGRDEVDLTGPSFPLDRVVREREVGTLVHLAHPRILTANRSLGEAMTAMKNVLDVCGENGLRLVYLSGWEVFSGYRTSHPLTAEESLPPLPGSVYGYSKALCESLMQQMADFRGFRYCLVRSGPVFGRESSRPRFIRTFIDKALRNESIVVHRYSNDLPRLDLMHVDDLVAGIKSVVDVDATGVFHLGSGTLLSTTEIAKRVSHKLGSDSPIVAKNVDSEVCNVTMSTAKARARLAWSPKVDPGRALDELIEDIASQGVDDPDPMSERTNYDG